MTVGRRIDEENRPNKRCRPNVPINVPANVASLESVWSILDDFFCNALGENGKKKSELKWRIYLAWEQK